MSIRRAYQLTDIQRKIDQAYEMAGLARQDRDGPDERRWLAEVERLKAIARQELD
jgi:hypothetical protein